MLRWVNSTEHVPEHNEQVLIQVNHVIDLATYDAREEKFIVATDGRRMDKADNLKWMRMVQPGTARS